MLSSKLDAVHTDTLNAEIRDLIAGLGEGKVRGVAYDTAWVARLAPRYPGYGFEGALEWLRRNQYPDGTWGGPLIQYHDRFVSTLAAIVALREVGRDPRDERRVKRGENALWKIVGRLGRDDSDTIGFPIIAAALTREAARVGLDVPLPPIRFAGAYRKKVQALLDSPDRDWCASTVSFSLEALRDALHETDMVLEGNGSVSSSPSATAGYLLSLPNGTGNQALHYLQAVQQDDGSVPAVAPIDLFEIAWTINHLRIANVIEPENFQIKAPLEHLWNTWSPLTGSSYSSYFSVKDADVTAATYTVLKWAGYPVNAETFEFYETEDHFRCYQEETNPALSAHVRLLAAMRFCEEHPRQPVWIRKIIETLHRFDDNGSYWWDKWHVSPYYVSSVALGALHGIDGDLSRSRLKWMLRTQNDDGGWGYLGDSTPEETAYCLQTLTEWHMRVEAIDRAVLDSAAEYLWKHIDDYHKVPLWIGKSLYYPEGPVRAAILGALAQYVTVFS